MKKLELKHIAPYLPYGLKCQCRDLGILELTSVSTINKDYQCWFESALDYNNRDFNYGILSRNSECGIGFNLDKIKPLLHSMSDLYKEIDGKVGVVELAKIAFKDNGYNFFKVKGKEVLFASESATITFRFYEEIFRFSDQRNLLEMMQYLFSHHYDVFLLIDKGLAIDINSISHE